MLSWKWWRRICDARFRKCADSPWQTSGGCASSTWFTPVRQFSHRLRENLKTAPIGKGRQHRLALGQKEYFIDLLFYHRFLKALVAFELKVGPFEPEYAGKMDFYLNLLNDTERGDGDQPSIGIILCAEKDDVEVEYALRTKANPIGVAAYQLQSKLPADLRGKLPTPKQLADVVRAVLPERSAP